MDEQLAFSVMSSKFVLPLLTAACLLLLMPGAAFARFWPGHESLEPVRNWKNHPTKEVLAKRAFCSAPGPRNYALPLAKLPEIHEFPYEKQGIAHLPFGPKKLGFYTWNFSAVLVNGGLYTYGLFNEAYDHPPTLNWTISAQLQSLDASGGVREKIAERSIKVKEVDNAYPPALKFEVPEKVGFYRVDIQFANIAGETLGEYSEYLRVVRPTVHVRLGINRRHFRHGQLVAFRVENVGTATATYGGDYWVARSTPQGWKGVDRLNERAIPAYFGLAGAGMAGRCSSFRVPGNLPQGLYRVSKSAGVTEDGKILSGSRPSTEFWVTDPPTS